LALEVGMVVEGTIIKITAFGAFVRLSDGTVGLVHISQITDRYVKDVHEFLAEGQSVKAKVIGFDEKDRPNLSLKLKSPKMEQKRQAHGLSFEEKLSRFLKESEERQEDLRKNLENKRR